MAFPENTCTLNLFTAPQKDSGSGCDPESESRKTSDGLQVVQRPVLW